VTVIGHAATIAAGEWMASGEWVNARTSAVQGAVPPHVAADVGRRHREVPLGRHDLGRWSRLREKPHFGEKVFDVIEATPDRRADDVNWRPTWTPAKTALTS
jgi:hypothetical protein